MQCQNNEQLIDSKNCTQSHKSSKEVLFASDLSQGYCTHQERSFLRALWVGKQRTNTKESRTQCSEPLSLSKICHYGKYFFPMFYMTCKFFCFNKKLHNMQEFYGQYIDIKLPKKLVLKY